MVQEPKNIANVINGSPLSRQWPNPDIIFRFKTKERGVLVMS